MHAIAEITAALKGKLSRRIRRRVVGALRALSPLPEVLNAHAAEVDRALGVLGDQLDQVECVHISSIRDGAICDGCLLILQ